MAAKNGFFGCVDEIVTRIRKAPEPNLQLVSVLTLRSECQLAKYKPLSAVAASLLPVSQYLLNRPTQIAITHLLNGPHSRLLEMLWGMYQLCAGAFLRRHMARWLR